MVSMLKRHWLFLLPLASFGGYYTLQNVPGFFIYPRIIVLKFSIALALATASYIAAYCFIPIEWAKSISVNPPSPRRMDQICLLIVGAFCLIVITACATTDRIPLVEALKGAPFGELFEDRNNFLRGRPGAGQILNYGFAILSQGLMPLALAYGFWARTHWRWFALTVFALGVSLTLAKAALVCVAIPLIALFLMQSRWRAAASTLAAFAVTVAIMSTLSSGAVGAIEAKATGEAVAPDQIQLPADTPAHYNVFQHRSTVHLIANRIFWIPYATGLDWFRYQSERMDGRFVLGQSIRPIAFLLGRPRLYLEQEVAALQWGSLTGATANAVFFADAWLNWGPIGVILYSAFLGLTIKLIITSGYPPLIAASAFPVWLAGVSALPPVYFSGGLGFLLLLALVFREKDLEKVRDS